MTRSLAAEKVTAPAVEAVFSAAVKWAYARLRMHHAASEGLPIAEREARLAEQLAAELALLDATLPLLELASKRAPRAALASRRKK